MGLKITVFTNFNFGTLILVFSFVGVRFEM
jgi:hypothetical protein